MPQANATYSTKSWDRRPFGAPATELGAMQLGRIEMVHTYKGDIEAEGILQYLIAYTKDGNGCFVGLEKVTGTIGGKSGSFVLQCTGTAENERLKQRLVIVPDSGTGELRGLRGQAEMECDLHMDEYPFTLEYEVE